MPKRAKDNAIGNNDKKKRKHLSLSIVQKWGYCRGFKMVCLWGVLVKNMVWELPPYMTSRNRKTSCWTFTVTMMAKK